MTIVYLITKPFDYKNKAIIKLKINMCIYSTKTKIPNQKPLYSK